MLYATEGVDTQDDFNKPMVGVASVWYEGNPYVIPSSKLILGATSISLALDSGSRNLSSNRVLSDINTVW